MCFHLTTLPRKVGEHQVGWVPFVPQIGSIDPPPKLKMCDFYGQDFWCQALEHVAQQEVQSAKQSPKLRESQTESVAWRNDELPGGYKTDSCWKWISFCVLEGKCHVDMQQYCETAEGEEHKKDTEAEKPPKYLDWEIPGGKSLLLSFLTLSLQHKRHQNRS